jgi:Ser/Thr protein kinase RdoA (MazF antagonist)
VPTPVPSVPTLRQEIDALREPLREVLAAYGVSRHAPVTLLDESENITFRVGGQGFDDHGIEGREPGRPLILRVYRHGAHDAAAIRSELAWMEAVRRDGGIVTPEVVRALDGEALQTFQDNLREGPRHAAMFSFLTGREPAQGDIAGTFERLGAIAARMHRHARAWRKPAWFTRPTWDFDTMIRRDRPIWGRWQDGLGLQASDRNLLDRACGILARRLDAFGRDPDRFGLIHADLRVTNLLVEGRDTKVIDFDDCGFGWHLYDLGAALTFIEDHPEAEALAAAWLHGYGTVRPLTGDETGEVPTFRLLRRVLIVAWIASHIESETARANGEAYTRGTCAEAERYLARFG